MNYQGIQRPPNISESSPAVVSGKILYCITIASEH